METDVYANEKRSFVRVQTNNTVSITLHDDPKEQYSARCVDLSGSGMQLETSKHLNIGSRLRIHVQGHPSHRVPLKAHGRVIWAKQKQGSSLYKCGVYLERMEKH